MKTPYNEIVNIASIGSQTNPISLNEILRKANDSQDKITVICNVIVRTARFTFTQNDYIPNGTLVDCSKLLIGQRSTVWQLCKDIVGADWE